MEIREVQDKNEWQNFVASFKISQFLQSWQWGEFQQNLGRKIYHLAVYQDNKIIGAALIIKMPLPFGKSYLYCPRGPILKENSEEMIKIFFKKVKEVAKKEKSIFLRFEPFNKLQPTTYKLQKVGDVQPSKTLLIDLTKSEEEILAAMHPKTRYNIRLAERKGVRIKEGNSTDIELFLNLTHQTSERDNFLAHSDNYYRKMIGLNSDFIKIYLAQYQGKILAANLMIYFGDTCTYLHGASSDSDKNVMAPHLLQWYCISQAKKAGYKYYDFWGIDEKKWPGVTRLKKSFISEKTGLEISYFGTFDLSLNKKWYLLYSIARRIINN